MKKRTIKPYYGKTEHRLQGVHRDAVMRNDHELATAAMNRLTRRIAAKRARPARGRRNKTAISVGGRFAQTARGY